MLRIPPELGKVSVSAEKQTASPCAPGRGAFPLHPGSGAQAEGAVPALASRGSGRELPRLREASVRHLPAALPTLFCLVAPPFLSRPIKTAGVLHGALRPYLITLNGRVGM